MPALTDFVELVRTPTSSPGVYTSSVRYKGTPPPFLKAAIADAQNLVNIGMYGLGGATPDQLFNSIIGSFERRIANARTTFASQPAEWVEDYIFRQTGGIQGIQKPAKLPTYKPVSPAAEPEEIVWDPAAPEEEPDPAPVAPPPPPPSPTGPGSGQPQNTPAASTQPPPSPSGTAAAVSPLFDPTHRAVGTDAAGNTVYRLIDEAGDMIQWVVIGGQATDFRNLGPALQAAAYVQPAAVAAADDDDGPAVATPQPPDLLASLRLNADFASLPQDWQLEIAAQVAAGGLQAAKQANLAWAAQNPTDPHSPALARWASDQPPPTSPPAGGSGISTPTVPSVEADPTAAAAGIVRISALVAAYLFLS